MSASERGVGRLIAVAGQCHRALAELVEPVWIAKRVLGSSAQGPRLAIEETADGVRLDLRVQVETFDDEQDDWDLAVLFQVSLEVTPDWCRVTSVVEADLDKDMGEFGPGDHVLYERSTETRGVDAALHELRAHVLTLQPLEDITVRLGWHPEWSPPETPMQGVWIPVPATTDAEEISALAVIGLLRTVEQCRRELNDAAERFRLGHEFAPETNPEFVFHLAHDEGPARFEISAGTQTRLDPDSILWETNDLDRCLVVAAAGPGLRIASRLEASLSGSMGEYPEGIHVLFERRSPILDFDDAMAEAVAQTAAFGDLEAYTRKLGLAPISR